MAPFYPKQSIIDDEASPMDRSCFVLVFESTGAWTSPAYAPGARLGVEETRQNVVKAPVESLKQIKIVNVA